MNGKEPALLPKTILCERQECYHSIIWSKPPLHCVNPLSGICTQIHPSILLCNAWQLITGSLICLAANKLRTFYDGLPVYLIVGHGDHKLISRYCFVVHGGINGFSRLIVYLRASTNNRADTVLQLFMKATTFYNISSQVRSNMGLENIAVGRFMLQTSRCNRGSIITGNSVYNQIVERLWHEVNRLL